MASSTAGQGLSEASWTDRHAEKQSQCQCSGRWRRWLHISESFQNISLRVREFLSLSLSAAAASVRWISLGLSLGPRHACAAQQAVPPPPHPENSLSVPPGRHSLSSRCVWRLVVARAHPEYQCLQKSRERSYTRTSAGGRTDGRTRSHAADDGCIHLPHSFVTNVIVLPFCCRCDSAHFLDHRRRPHRRRRQVLPGASRPHCGAAADDVDAAGATADRGGDERVWPAGEECAAALRHEPPGVGPPAAARHLVQGAVHRPRVQVRRGRENNMAVHEMFATNAYLHIYIQYTFPLA